MNKKSIIFISLALITVIAHGSHFKPGLRPKISLSFDYSCLQIANSLGLINFDLLTKEKVFKIFQKISQDRQIAYYNKDNLFKASVYAHARNLYRDHGEYFFEVYYPKE